MKKIVCLWMLVTGITGELYAQQPSNAEKIFDIPAGILKRSFMISLDKGNKMQLELTEMEDLAYLKNIDSLILAVSHDMAPLKDSLADELYARRIDYIMDTNGIKKIRIQKIIPKGSHFVINKGELASLKTDQDIICITGMAKGTISGMFLRKKPGIHYYRVCFYLNDLQDLSLYMHGELNEKITSLEQNADNHWNGWVANKDGTLHLKSVPGISAPASHGFIDGGDMLSLRLSVDAQNYKNYFVPSASIGFAVITTNNLVKREYGLSGEFHFMFTRNSAGKLESFVNEFLTVSYGRRSIKEPGSKQGTGLYPYFSFGYLVKRRGDFFDKNSFKLGLGSFSLFGGSTKIEPVFYFNNFFKGVTPSLRITQNF